MPPDHTGSTGMPPEPHWDVLGAILGALGCPHSHSGSTGGVPAPHWGHWGGFRPPRPSGSALTQRGRGRRRCPAARMARLDPGEPAGPGGARRARPRGRRDAGLTHPGPFWPRLYGLGGPRSCSPGRVRQGAQRAGGAALSSPSRLSSGKRKGRGRKWQLQTFDPPSPCAAPPDLASGVTLAHVLHQIDPSWFDEAWLGRIRGDTEGSARLKVNNLRQVLQSVLEYWQDVLGQAVGEQHVPDVGAAARHGDPEQLRRLVRLVLGCAVSCQRREEHIQRIMTLEESVQHEVMTAIQELLDPEPSEPMAAETYGNFDAQEPPEEGSGQRCRELEQQVATLLEEKGHLAAENRALREQLEAEGAGAAAKKLLRLQAQVEELQEENYRLESGREELRARCSRLEQEARGLQARAQELSGLAGEARALRDEMDLLRASSARAGRLEAAVAAYRGRAAAAGELRRWARALEERHAAQVRRAAHLQQQLGRAQAGCAQLEAARKQVEELSGQQAEAALRAEKWHLEFRHLQERFEALSQEKERLLEERDALREANEELRCVQVQQSYLSQAGAGLEEGPAPPQNLAAEILPAELRDTVTRLRRENRRLRLQRDQLRHRLEATGAAEPQTAQGGPQEELVLLEETPEDLDELPEGEEEEEEEELELSKAGFRSSRSSPPQKPSGPPGDPPGTPPLAPVLQLLRSQLQEKDALIRHLENDWERSRAQREREERLLVTAWYNMGLALQQHEGDATAAAAWGGPGGARSFLAQQRLATAARRARAPHGRAASSS
ncbi:protein Hook homolog 2-like isoform X4 [Agelaius tricolor]|uniref:protein Hook homolog 2-like isoform X4 n=1 Tax=Agelaius tricolor TaxID=9191 RepID=UPI0039F1FEF2